jgi:hypothetical protein
MFLCGDITDNQVRDDGDVEISHHSAAVCEYHLVIAILHAHREQRTTRNTTGTLSSASTPEQTIVIRCAM